MSWQERNLYKFGPFVLDPALRTLTRDEEPVPLQPQVFATLLKLVESDGLPVRYEELIAHVWPDTSAARNNLDQALTKLRKALGDPSAEPKYIRTVPKVGYQFIAPVEVVNSVGIAPSQPLAEVSAVTPLPTREMEVKSPPEVGGGTASDRGSRSHRSHALALGLIVAFAAVALGAVWVFTRGGSGVAEGPVEMVRLTNGGKAANAALSPDGKYVAYALDNGGRQSIWVRQVSTGAASQLVPTVEDEVAGVTFSPDSSYVYYVAAGSAHRLPVLGGMPRKVADGLYGSLSVSPDGARVAFVRREPATQEQALMVADADGAGERRLMSLKRPEGFYRWPSWSPDGKLLAAVATNGADRFMRVVGIRVEDGTLEVLNANTWDVIDDVEWLPDGRGLVVSAREMGNSLVRALQLWRLDYPSGQVGRITNDLSNYFGVSLTGDGRALVTIQSEQRSYLWVVPSGGAGDAKQVTSGREYVNYGAAWTPDGRIVYPAAEGTNVKLWSVGADGRDRRQVTDSPGFGVWPSVSPDGELIVYLSDRSGALNVWRAELSGAARQLTHGASDGLPQLSPDGRWVIYVAGGGIIMTIWKVSVDGGEPVQLTQKFSNFPTWSPDGRFFACTYRTGTDQRQKIAVIPAEGGEPVKLLDLPPTGAPGRMRWTPDGDAIAYIDTRDGVSNVWALPLDGGPPRPLTAFDSERIMFFEWARDGSRLAVARSTEVSDIVLMKSVR